MRMPWSNRQGPMKMLVICVTVLLVASGLCGVQGMLAGVLRFGKSDFLVGPIIALGIVGFAAILLSIGGMVIALIWLLFKTIASNSRSGMR